MAKARKKRTRSSKLTAKLYAILSGKTHRVVARTKKLTTARKRAAGLVRRGSKHVSIRRGTSSFPLGAAKRRSKRRTSRKAGSRRRVSKNRGKRHSRRRVSKNGKRRSHRRASKRRTSRRRH